MMACPPRGFLPDRDPLRRLPPPFDPWEELASELPRLLAARVAARRVAALPVLDTSGLEQPDERERAMLLLGFFANASVWEEGGAIGGVPRSVTIPWCRLAHALGRPPTLAYASHALRNWRRIDPEGPVALGNLAVLQNFLGGLDEDWFILSHVAIEALAVPALRAVDDAIAVASADEPELLAPPLERLAAAQAAMYGALLRLPERCEPDIFSRRIQPFLRGFPAERDVYEGATSDVPAGLPGASAAQSAVLPALDAALGVEHEPDHLSVYLSTMRRHMPREHRAYLTRLEERGPAVRACLLRHRERRSVAAYDACLGELERFRETHLEYAASFIQGPARKQQQAGVSTGGTPFMPYLKKLRDETARHRIGEGP